MFENLTFNLKAAWSNLIGKNKITESDLDLILVKVRKSLLEADVALVAINSLMEAIKNDFLHKKFEAHFNAEQFLIKLIKDELISLMGPTVELKINNNKLAVILIVGLQGSGKTTTAAKIAKYLQDKQQKKVMLASCDIYRSAAILQLQQLSNQIGASFFSSNAQDQVQDIVSNALKAAKQQSQEVLIIDTAGRLHVDEKMMQEAVMLHNILNPVETLFVIDGMTGQDAVNTAKKFNEQLPITGVILTKLDGDLRGGVALSVRHVTGKPIKFFTTGEKLDAIEVFHADRIASRILGMGDILSLVEEIQSKVDRSKAEKMAKQAIKGEFNLILLREQLLQMRDMGGIKNLIDKIPGFSAISEQVKAKINDNEIKTMLALIDSMTYKERIYPSLLNVKSRQQRICKGSGNNVVALNKLLRHFAKMQKMFKNLSSGKIFKMLQAIKDKMPPGFTNF